MANNNLRFISAVLLVLCLAASSKAQVTFGAPTSVGTGITYYHWRLDGINTGKTTFSQLVMPINGFVPIKDNFEILFYAVGSVNDLETTGQKTGLTGASDVRLRPTNL